MFSASIESIDTLELCTKDLLVAAAPHYGDEIQYLFTIILLLSIADMTLLVTQLEVSASLTLSAARSWFWGLYLHDYSFEAQIPDRSIKGVNADVDTISPDRLWGINKC